MAADGGGEEPGGHAARAMAAKPIDDGRALFSISDLAAEFGVSTRTIRFYEGKGLLSPQRVGKARVFDRRDRARLALILRAKAIGASLEEAKHFLDLYGGRGEGRRDQLEFLVRRCEEEIAALERKRALIDDTVRDIRELRAQGQAALEGLKG